MLGIQTPISRLWSKLLISSHLWTQLLPSSWFKPDKWPILHGHYQNRHQSSAIKVMWQKKQKSCKTNCSHLLESNSFAMLCWSFSTSFQLLQVQQTILWQAKGTELAHYQDGWSEDRYQSWHCGQYRREIVKYGLSAPSAILLTELHALVNVPDGLIVSVFH